MVRLPRIEAALVAEPVEVPETGENLPLAAVLQRQRVTKLRYFAKLLINGRQVGTSHVRHMRDDFTLDFSDVFRRVKLPIFKSLSSRMT